MFTLSEIISNKFIDIPFTVTIYSSSSGEHSPVDALVPSIVAEYVALCIVQGVDAELFKLRGTRQMVRVRKDLTGWQMKRCGRSVGQLLRELIRSSIIRMMVLCGLTSLGVNGLNLHGLKPKANSPFHTKQFYTRMFKHGRTEILRAFSRESRHWVLSILDSRFCKLC